MIISVQYKFKPCSLKGNVKLAKFELQGSRDYIIALKLQGKYVMQFENESNSLDEEQRAMSSPCNLLYILRYILYVL